MPEASLRIIAKVKARSDSVDELRKLLRALVEPTRNEEGCINYELLQSQSDPTEFIFLEEWESVVALDRHSSSDHMKNLRSKLPLLIDSPPEARRFSIVV
ncbi:MAG: antibiotic biosynthesis monooxygenase [Acidobacteria bacterium]|nr:MAG: antibiotic biosynthesis monooxygenase [Acidobacteriota bacterium]